MVQTNGCPRAAGLFGDTARGTEPGLQAPWQLYTAARELASGGRKRFAETVHATSEGFGIGRADHEVRADLPIPEKWIAADLRGLMRFLDLAQ